MGRAQASLALTCASLVDAPPRARGGASALAGAAAARTGGR